MIFSLITKSFFLQKNRLKRKRPFFGFYLRPTTNKYQKNLKILIIKMLKTKKFLNHKLFKDYLVVNFIVWPYLISMKI